MTTPTTKDYQAGWRDCREVISALFLLAGATSGDADGHQILSEIADKIKALATPRFSR